MLADPRHSRIVLINLARDEQADVLSEVAARRRASLSLLPACRQIFEVGTSAIGEFDPTRIPQELAGSISVIDIDGLSFWRDSRSTEPLAAAGGGIVFLGGAWLEEEVFVAALEGVRLGYDIRLLADIALARVEGDRPLVLDRLAQHGVLATTVRQTMLEWAVCVDDPVLKQKVQQLLV